MKKTDADRLADATAIIRQKNAELADNRKLIASLQQEEDTARAIRENVYKIAAYDPNPPEWLVRSSNTNHRGTPIVMFSDWHYGEVVEPAEVAGMNCFNKDIAKKRIKTLTEKTVDLSHNHMGNAKIKYHGIVVCLGGDMIGGDIHEELMKTNDRTTQQCIEDLIDLLAASIETIAGKFDKVFVPCVVGNHGRSTKKPQMKQRIISNHEWNIYCGLARYFKNNKNVQFYIPEETDAFFTVHGHRFLLTHGDSLGSKGGEGILGAVAPIVRGGFKTGLSEKCIGRDYDTLLIGHWHQSLWLHGIITNGSLKGYDDFARLTLRAPYSLPSQNLFFVHPKHGITARWTINLDEKPTVKTQAKTWLSW